MKKEKEPAVKRKLGLFVKLILSAFGAVFLSLVVLQLHTDWRHSIYDWAGECLDYRLGDQLYRSICCLKDELYENLQEFSGIIMTSNTILAAAVIFFYSVMDNRKEGIPHRVIMSYSYGSYATPVLFFTTLILSPLLSLMEFAGLKFMEAGCIVMVLGLQLVIIWMVLRTTSFSFCLKNICMAEKKELDNLRNSYDQEREGRPAAKETDRYADRKRMNYFEVALKSEELMQDKIELFDSLLRAPFLHISKRKEGKRPAAESQLRMLYQYYYVDLSSALFNMSESNKYNQNKVRLSLCHFCEEMQEKDLRKLDPAGDQYDPYVEKEQLMIFCSIFGALIVSGMNEAKECCTYLLSRIQNESFRKKLVQVYLLFQELLKLTNTQAVLLEEYGKADANAAVGTTVHAEESLEVLTQFWQIWTEETSLQKKECAYCFWNAVSSLYFDRNKSVYIAYYLKHLNKGVR